MKTVSQIHSLCFILTVFTSIYSSGCKDNTSSASSTIQSNFIVPLKVGNQWSLTAYDYDSAGVIQTNSILMLVSRDTVINGQVYYELPVHLLYTLDSNGLLIKDNPYNQILFKYPTFKGDMFSTFGDSVTVLTTDTLITVPAGTFNCIQYSYKSNSTWFVSPGIGFVKHEARKINSDGNWFVYSWRTLNNVILK